MVSGNVCYFLRICYSIDCFFIDEDHIEEETRLHKNVYFSNTSDVAKAPAACANSKTHNKNETETKPTNFLFSNDADATDSDHNDSDEFS